MTVPSAITIATKPEGVTDACLERSGNLEERHTGGHPYAQRGKGEGNESRHPRPGHKDHDQRDTGSGDEQEKKRIGWTHMWQELTLFLGLGTRGSDL